MPEESEPVIRPGAPEAPAYLEEFRSASEASLRHTFAGPRLPGELRSLVLDDREDGTHATATFVLDAHPGTTFVYDRLILPTWGADKSDWLAVSVFTTVLVERYHTRARHQAPENGTVRC
jgi:hypothetical protein